MGQITLGLGSARLGSLADLMDSLADFAPQNCTGRGVELSMGWMGFNHEFSLIAQNNNVNPSSA
jgi:hypothetical protein